MALLKKSWEKFPNKSPTTIFGGTSGEISFKALAKIPEYLLGESSVSIQTVIVETTLGGFYDKRTKVKRSKVIRSKGQKVKGSTRAKKSKIQMVNRSKGRNKNLVRTKGQKYK